MARRRKKGSGCGCGCLLTLVIGVGFYHLFTRPIPLPPPEDSNQVAADRNRALDDRIRVLTEKEASLRQSAAEGWAKAKAEKERLSPEERQAFENMVRGNSGHYGFKRTEGNARYAEQIADETRREIERLKAGRSK